MAIDPHPQNPGSKDTPWTVSEDVNVVRLFDVWNACADFVGHLNWCKPRLTAPKVEVEGLPDGHCSKPGCLWKGSGILVAQMSKELSDANGILGLGEEGLEIFQRVGNAADQARCLIGGIIQK